MNIKDIDNVQKTGETQQHWQDSRKPKLTLKHLNKLRKMQELKKLEMSINQEQLEKIYGQSE